MSRKIDKHIQFIVRADIRFLNIDVAAQWYDTLLHSTNCK